MPPDDDVASQPAGLRLFGNYELIHEIARGGMGLVYKARQLNLDRLVAVKLLLSGEFASEHCIQRFRAEAAAAASLKHPNIVTVYEVGEHNGHQFFSMDYIAGKNLAELARENPLPATQAAGYVQVVGQAIHFAHQHGILHRDLKPSNVLIDHADQPQITDFGLAKRLLEYSDLTVTGQVLGSPNFMPPEQAAGRNGEVGVASDVYSLGAILYYLLTARPPFVADSLEATIGQVLHEQPVPPGLLNPSIPRDLETICLKCLEKNSARRYDSAQALADDLGRFLRGEPIIARPPSPIEKAWRWCRARPAVASMSLLSIGLLLALAIASTVMNVRISSAHKSEQNERQRAERILGEMRLQTAEELFRADNALSALAYLGGALRQNPSNQVVAARILSALTYRDFPLPMCKLKHGAEVTSIQFSPDGGLVVSSSLDSTARIWKVPTGGLVAELRHAGGVRHVEFSPDGRLLATASDDGTARLWDAHTGQALAKPLEHRARVVSARFSPDGNFLLTASADKTARVWSIPVGLLHAKFEHDAELTSARFSSDGTRVITASQNGLVRVWDPQTGRLVIPPVKHSDWVGTAVITPDGKRVVTRSRKSVRIWDAHTGVLLLQPLQNEHSTYATSLAPDGQKLVTASDDMTAHVWDFQTGCELTRPLKHSDWVKSAEFSSDGARILTASDDRTARVWNAVTGQPLTEPLRLDRGISLAHFSPDGQWVVTASGDNLAWIWDIRPGRPLTESLKHEARINCSRFSSNGRKVVTASSDHTAQIWDAFTFRRLTRALCHESAVPWAEFSPDGRRVVTASADSTARIWDPLTGEPVIAALRHDDQVWSARFSSDGQRLVTASYDRTARIWNTRTGQPIGSSLIHGGFVRSARFSPNGQYIATASDDHTGRTWNALTGQALTAPLKHEDKVSDAQFSPDSLRVVTISYDCTARIWDVRTGLPSIPPLRHDSRVTFAEFSADNWRLVTASENKRAWIWDSRTGQPLTPPLTHDSWIVSARFSPDSQRVVTASSDGTARVWDTSSGQAITEALGFKEAVTTAEFSPDGQRVIAASVDGSARIWEVPTLPLPIPNWLADLAEALGGQRLNAQGVLESVPSEKLLSLKQKLAARSRTDFYDQWAKWFFSDRATRAISPASRISIRDLVERRCQENTVESLREALRLSPTNSLALARLARHLMVGDSNQNFRQRFEADFCSRRAVELSPDELEVQETRAEVLNRISRQKQ